MVLPIIIDGYRRCREHQELERLKREAEANDDPTAIYIAVLGEPKIATRSGVTLVSTVTMNKILPWKVLAFLLLKNRPVALQEIHAAIYPNEPYESDNDRIRQAIYDLQNAVTFANKEKLFTLTHLGYSVNKNLHITCDILLVGKLLEQARNLPEGSRKRLELLRQIQQLYRGRINGGYFDEVALSELERPFEWKFREASELLFEELDRKNDYPCITDYASDILQKFSGDPNALYWLIYSLIRREMRADAAEKMCSARAELGDEYEDLLYRLQRTCPE